MWDGAMKCMNMICKILYKVARPKKLVKWYIEHTCGCLEGGSPAEAVDFRLGGLEYVWSLHGECRELMVELDPFSFLVLLGGFMDTSLGKKQRNY